LLEDLIVYLDLLGPFVDKVRIGHRDELVYFIILYSHVDPFLELVEDVSKCLKDIDFLLLAIYLGKDKVVVLEAIQLIIDDMVLIRPFLDITYSFYELFLIPDRIVLLFEVTIAAIGLYAGILGFLRCDFGRKDAHEYLT
jgi:hypothetical protein